MIILQSHEGACAVRASDDASERKRMLSLADQMHRPEKTLNKQIACFIKKRLAEEFMSCD